MSAPACGISVGIAEKAEKGSPERDHKRIGILKRTKTANGLAQGPSALRIKELLNLNRKQLRCVV
jgi:hypothetical protein